MRLRIILVVSAALTVSALSARPADNPPSSASTGRLARLNPDAIPRGRLVSATPLDVAPSAAREAARAEPTSGRRVVQLPAEAAGATAAREAPSCPAAPAGLPGWSACYIDVPCDVFLPSKGSPTQRMSSVTVVEQSSDGYYYQHGYDDFTQTYDMVVSGYQVDGVMYEESVAIALATIPDVITPWNVDGVEFCFLMTETNNYASEMTGLVDITSEEPPHCQSTENQWDEWYYDARGLWGNIYYVGAFQPRSYVIDLGPDAVTDLSERVGYPGWFGVGMAGDGWDLTYSSGDFVYNRSAGGGDATPGRRPFFRIYYNVPPAAFDLVSPAAGARTTEQHPCFTWQAARDPNRGDAVTYRLEYDVSPEFPGPVSVNGLTDTTWTATVPLARGNTYYWRVCATDERQNERWSTGSRQLVVENLTGVGEEDGAPPAALRLGAPWPNPTRGALSVAVAAGGDARLEVLDVQGRLVTRLACPPEPGIVRWDGRAGNGLPVGAGNYYLVLSAADRREVRAVRVIR